MDDPLTYLQCPSNASLPEPTPRPPSHTISRLHAHLSPAVADTYFFSFVRRLELSPRAHVAEPPTYFQLFAGRQFLSIVSDIIGGVHHGCWTRSGDEYPWMPQDGAEMWALLGVTWEEMATLQSLLEEEISWLESRLEEVMDLGEGLRF
ncbi:MAG: hypothetical protein Q9165_001505 [Trypethelium subeluteriae]